MEKRTDTSRKTPLHDSIFSKQKTASNIIADSIDSKFNTFFKTFMEDSVFQKKRVLFPLKLVFVGDEGEKDSVKFISNTQWRAINFSDYPKEKEIVKTTALGKTKVSVQIQIEDTDIETGFEFIKKNDQWWLSSTKVF